ncbi:WD40/YVTN/BNR-like repeat-containing protein [Nocardioides sp.]|uniref:WD40/YVTN/BNR-like repeat-containing protein n=1 Tax=Nocardioides sp. TaxID=35761 RepID=UPI0039E5FB2F
MRAKNVVIGAAVALWTAVAVTSGTAPAEAVTPASAKLKVKAWQQVALPVGSIPRDVSTVSARVVWVADWQGGILRTTNAGRSWRRTQVTDPADYVTYVAGVSKKVAYAITAPTTFPATSTQRLLRTGNGGRTWRPVLTPPGPDYQLSCLAMAPDGKRGFVVGKQVSAVPYTSPSQLHLWVTKGAGKRWAPVAAAASPSEFPTTRLDHTGLSGCFVQQGGSVGIVLQRYTVDPTTYRTNANYNYLISGSKWGRHWRAPVELPPAAGGMGFVQTVAARGKHVLAVGGVDGDDIFTTPGPSWSAVRSRWSVGGTTPGYMLDVSWVPGRPKTAVAVGFGGTAVTTDRGRTWLPIDQLELGQVSCAGTTCWAAPRAGATLERLRLR